MIGQVEASELFSVEDQAKMEKLLKDVSAWMNKYADLLDNPQMYVEVTQEKEATLVEADPFDAVHAEVH